MTTTSKTLFKTRRQIFFWLIKLIVLIGLIVVKVKFPDLKKALGINTLFFDALLFYIIGNLIVDFSRLILIEIYYKRFSEKAQANFALGINRIANIISFLLIILTIFILFQIEVVKVITSLTIVAAAIAIIFKEFIVNFIYGLVIMFTDEISLGDRVEIKSRRGQIADITLLKVHLITDDSELVLFPNSLVMESDVINYTKRAINRINFDFTLDYGYLKELVTLENLLRDALEPYKAYIEEKSHNLKTVQINKDSALMKYQYTLLQSDSELELTIRRVVARKILEFVNNN